MTRHPLVLLSLAIGVTGAAFGQSNSSSASYELLHAAPGGGGGQVSGGNITAEISVGDGIAGGVSDITTAGVQQKGGYIGQLYDPIAVGLSAAPTTVDEGATRQLAAEAVMDDATTLALDPADAAWSVVSGPLAGIGADGVAVAGSVYQDTNAVARGTWLSLDGDLTLTVINVGVDDFGIYAGDGIDDDWQVDHFGEGNTDAAPDKNPDGDGDDNLLEFRAMTDPTDPTSFFSTELVATPDQPGKHDIIFSPLAPGRTYMVMVGSDPDPASFAELTGTTTVEDGGVRTVTDNDTTPVRRFYKVAISKP